MTRLALTLLFIAGAAPALAQSTQNAQNVQEAAPTQRDGQRESSDEAARRLFGEGMAHLAAGRASTAADFFRESLGQVPRTATGFNLGLALRDAGRPREAMTVVEALLRGEYGTLDAGRRPEAERLRDEVADHLAALEVRLTGVDRAALFIDEREAGTLADGETFSTWLAPGPHDLVATVANGTSVEERVELEAGVHTRVVLNVTAGSPTFETQSEAGEGRGGASPWLWVGLGTIVVGAAIVIAILLGGGSSQGTTDPVYGRIETLTF